MIEAEHLSDRVASMRSWAISRIVRCRAQEQKFAESWQIGRGHGPPQALIEAQTERRALTAALEMLSPGYLERIDREVARHDAMATPSEGAEPKGEP